MKFFTWAGQHDRFLILTTLLILGLGIGAFLKSDWQKEKPEREPVVFIRTDVPGTTAAEIDQTVSTIITADLKDKLGLSEIYSRSGYGFSEIRFTIPRNTGAALQALINQRLAYLQKESLPPLATISTNYNFDQLFEGLIIINNDGFTQTEIEHYALDIQKALLYLPGVDAVNIYPQFPRLEPQDTERLISSPGNETIITANEMNNRFAFQHWIVEGAEQIPVIFSLYRGDFSESSRARLNYISISDETRPSTPGITPETAFRLNGKPAVAMAISISDNLGCQEQTYIMQTVLRYLQENYPIGLQFQQIISPASRSQYDHKTTGLILLGGLLLIFLITFVGSGVRPAIAIFLTVSTALSCGFILFLLLGFSYTHYLTLFIPIIAGWIAALCHLNNHWQNARGLNPPRDQCGGFALTLALIGLSWWLPFALRRFPVPLDIQPRLFIFSALAILTAVIIQRILWPAIIKYPVLPQARTAVTFLQNRRSLLFLGLLLVLLTASLSLLVFSAKTVCPAVDPAMIIARLKTQAGSTSDYTTTVTSQLDAFLSSGVLNDSNGRPQVQSWLTFQGGTAPRLSPWDETQLLAPNEALLILVPSNNKYSWAISAALRQYSVDNLPELDIQIATTEPSRISFQTAELVFLTSSPKVAEKISSQLDSYFKQSPGVVQIHRNWPDRTKFMNIIFYQKLLSEYNLNANDVARAVRSCRGIFSSAGLSELTIRSKATKKSTPITRIADLRLQWNAPEIHHIDERLYFHYTLDFTQNINTRAFSRQLRLWMDRQTSSLTAPDFQYSLANSGSVEYRQTGRLAITLGIACILAFLICLLAFNRIGRSFLVLSTAIGFAGIGLGLSTLVTGCYNSLFALFTAANTLIITSMAVFWTIKSFLDNPGAIRKPLVLANVTFLAALLPAYLWAKSYGQLLYLALAINILTTGLLSLIFLPAIITLFFVEKSSAP